jgi:hypothetical protein
VNAPTVAVDIAAVRAALRRVADEVIGDTTAPADCHVSADLVALLLVAYGRRSQWIPILTGKLVAWGRKPWLGPRLTGNLVTP